MSEALSDETTSINSIYMDSTLVPISLTPTIHALTFPPQPSISLRLEFPPDYPETPPSILGTQSVGNDAAKGTGASLVDLARSVLAETYTPGVPCIFDLIEETSARLPQLGLEPSRRGTDEGPAESQDAQADGQHSHPAPGDGNGNGNDPNATQAPDALALDVEPPWTLSEPVAEKKSVFIARCAPVASVAQAKAYLAHLLATDKKAAKATHNITAWRIRDGAGGVQFQDCDDDGETAAGGRVLHLLELMGAWGMMVVVTRWYGGVQLGPDRFRIINQTAREAVVRAGFGPVEGQGQGQGGGKKKGGKK